MKLNNVNHFTSAFDLVEELLPDCLDHLTEDEWDCLRSIDDYEYFDYYVLNGSEVVICDGGTVIGQQPLDEYWTCTLDYIRQ